MRQPLLLYGRPGCHLCEESEATLLALLAARASAGRPVTTVQHRDIETDPAWERTFLMSIPVLEHGERRLELAIGPGKIGAFLDEVLG